MCWKWLKEIISEEVGAVHDCNFAEIDDTGKQVILSGWAVGSATVSGIDYNLGGLENTISPAITGTSGDTAPDEDNVDR